MWAVEYDGPPGEGRATEDNATSIATDDDGNVYVCGAAENLVEDMDFLTIKYGTAGNGLWTARYDGPAHKGDLPVSVHVDTLGNVYTAGSSEVDETDWDYATVKYDPAGNQLWVSRYDGGVTGMDSRVSDMTVDRLGNVYVTGASDTETTRNDYTTIKYDPEGNILWIARYAQDSDYAEGAVALALDEPGNVYVTGQDDDGDYTTIKYDSQGTELWAATYDGTSCEPSSLAVDGAGGVYVTGSCYGEVGSELDYVTVKYNSHGSELWAMSYNGSGNGDDLAHGLVLTDGGEALVTGESLGDGTWADVATVKYGTDGTQLWVARYNRYGNSWDGGSAIAADSEGNAYVTGTSEGSTSGKDYVTLKYDPFGDPVWATRLTLSQLDRASALALGPANSILVTGTINGIRGGHDILTVKYLDVDEAPSWTVGSTAMPATPTLTINRPAGLLVNLLLVFLPTLATAILLRLRHN